MLLLDEIQTGWGRTGALMAYMDYGIRPDIVSMAKAMGNGAPIGAFCATEKVASCFGAGAHGTTYGGNALACAASYAAIGEIIEKDLSARAAKTGTYFRRLLETLPHVKEVRGKGLLVGVEFDAPVAAAVKQGAIEGRLLVTALGDRVIRMVPPLIITESDCDKAFAILKAAAEKAYAADE